MWPRWRSKRLDEPRRSGSIRPGSNSRPPRRQIRNDEELR
jgi:hypothetical protein